MAFKSAIVAGALAVAAATPALAQEARAPVGPIEIVIGQAAGSTPDILMRRAAQIWNETKIIQNPIVVQNRTGGAWAVAFKYVLDRPGDENVLLAIAEPVFATPIVQGTDTVYDKVTPLATFAQTNIVFLALPDHKANTLAELFAIAKDAPRTVLVSGSTVGGTSHQVTGLLEKAGGVTFTYVPHSGGGEAQATFLGGNAPLIPGTIEETLPLIQSGKAKALAILTDQRRSEDGLKDIPTAKEQGFEAVFVQLFGLAGAANLDPAVKKWWEEKITTLVESPEWKKSIADNYMGSTFIIGEPLADSLKRHHEARLEILRAIGLSKL